MCEVVSGTVPGSSPRLRGTPLGDERRAAPSGIIPALAGNTCATAASTPETRDHPRACGEHKTTDCRCLRTPGSSPRLRGTRLREGHEEGGRGIIPALAGNTRCRARPSRCRRDHPRACGEHDDFSQDGAAAWGSSPRLRGTLIGELDAPAGEGIIPALAGNTKAAP